MNRFLIPPLLIAAALGGCTGNKAVETAPPTSAAYAPARLVRPEPNALSIGALGASSQNDQAAPAAAPGMLPGALPVPRESGPPLARVAAANRSAEREPSRHGYINASQIYDWAEGALYRLYTAPERVSEIVLQPGEGLISVAAGDTVRWVIGDTTSGTGGTRRTHILVKPTATGLRTNLVITTDRRTYHIALESSAGPAMASIGWTYPQDALLALDRANASEVSVSGSGGVNVEGLNFAYAIKGDDPPWRPLRAFDDGSQVFIEFPERLAQEQAPPLFVTGDGGRLELVNYRMRGRFYVVDRLFAAAELRLGERRQQIVRIVANDASRRRGRSR